MTGTTAATMRIGTRSIGGGAPLFVIAEIGLNHDGDPARALALVDAAARRRRLRRQAAVAARRDPGRARSRRRRRHARARRRAVAARRLRALRAGRGRPSRRRRARPRARPGLALEPVRRGRRRHAGRLDCDALKIASGDITHHRLIARAAATGKPLVISTGLSTLDEVAAAVTCAREGGARQHRAAALRVGVSDARRSAEPRRRSARSRPSSACRSASPITPRTPPASPPPWRSAPVSTSGTSRRPRPIR